MDSVKSRPSVQTHFTSLRGADERPATVDVGPAVVAEKKGWAPRGAAAKPAPTTQRAPTTAAPASAKPAAAAASPAVAQLNLDFLNSVTDSGRLLWSQGASAKLSPQQQISFALDFVRQLVSDPRNASIPVEVKQKALTRFFNEIPQQFQGPMRAAMNKIDADAFERDPSTSTNNVFKLRDRVKVVAQESVGDGEHLLLEQVYERLMPGFKRSPVKD